MCFSERQVFVPVWGSPAEGGGADGVVAVVAESTAGSATLLTIPAKPGMLASELTILSSLAALLAAAASGVLVGAGLCGAAWLATAPTAPAKLGMLIEMSLAMASMEGGGGGGAEGALVGAELEPPMELASPANEGMLLAMMSVIPDSVGKTPPLVDPPRVGGASSPEGGDTVTSSSDIS